MSVASINLASSRSATTMLAQETATTALAKLADMGLDTQRVVVSTLRYRLGLELIQCVDRITQRRLPSYNWRVHPASNTQHQQPNNYLNFLLVPVPYGCHTKDPTSTKQIADVLQNIGRNLRYAAETNDLDTLAETINYQISRYNIEITAASRDNEDNKDEDKDNKDNVSGGNIAKGREEWDSNKEDTEQAHLLGDKIEKGNDYP